MTFVVLALFGSTLVGIVRVVIALVGIAPVGIGTVGITLVGGTDLKAKSLGVTYTNQMYGISHQNSEQNCRG